MKRLISISTIALSISAIVFTVFGSIKPISNPDLWWHLKTGEYIVENHVLPEYDPFSYTSPKEYSIRNKVVLSGYYLTQIIYYAAHRTAGFLGILSLRFIIIALFIALIYYRSRATGGSHLLSLSCTAISMLGFLPIYMLDRPQILSFLFFCALMALLERYRDKNRLSYLLMPLMISWGWFHGGYIFGDIILLIFIAANFIQRGFNKNNLPPFFWALGGIACSFLSPNYWLPFFTILDLKEKHDFLWFVAEYQTTFSALATGTDAVLFVMLGIAITTSVTFFSGFVKRKIYLPDVLILLFTASSALMFMRNTAFFMTGLMPMAVTYIVGLQPYFKNVRFGVTHKLFAIIFLASSLGYWSLRLYREGNDFSIDRLAFYPQEAAAFIEQKQFRGPMFNEYDWGGYLIWRLYPKHKVFIDGRVLSEAYLQEYLTAARGSLEEKNGIPEYKRVLDSVGVQFILQPILQKGGSIQPLMTRLLTDNQWQPVYLDNLSYIFARTNGANQDIIKEFGISKRDFIGKLFQGLGQTVTEDRADARARVALGELYLFVNDLTRARQLFLEARALNPNHPAVIRNLQFIEQRGYRN